ncbi:MAG: transposase [Clostridia bacterium]
MELGHKEKASLSAFEAKTEFKLDQENRWVQRACIIPWGALEARFCSQAHAVKQATFRLGLAACLIQEAYGYSDWETACQIRESPYLQYFCGYSRYDACRRQPVEEDMETYRQCLQVETLQEINLLIGQLGKKPRT